MKLVFISMVTTPVSGDTLRAESEIIEIKPSRSKPDRGMVRVRTTTFNQRDEPVLSFTARLIVPKRTPV